MKVNGQEFITVQEMAKKLGISANTVNQRLFQKGIKPISKDALYELSALKAIKDTVMGRPKKVAGPEPVKPKKGKK
jgi:predicted ArsR family transcriptional regulator